MSINEELERSLVNYYNEFRPLFENIPPCYSNSIPIPRAKMKKDCKEEDFGDEVIFDGEDILSTEKGELAFMATRSILPDSEEDNRMRCVIIINKELYSCPKDLKSDLFPLLHEMTHVKERVLSKNNLSIDYEKFPEMFSKAEELHAGLNPDGRNPDDEKFVFLLCLLSEILKDENEKRKQQPLGVREINHPDPIKCLVEQLYPDKYVAYIKIQNKRKTK